jgi:CRP-like cAMP-binding protein
MNKCMDSLKLVSWFMFCSDAHLKEIASRMTKEVYPAGDNIIKQGDTHSRMIVVAEGSVERLR